MTDDIARHEVRLSIETSGSLHYGSDVVAEVTDGDVVITGRGVNVEVAVQQVQRKFERHVKEKKA